MIKTKKIVIEGVELDPISKICSLCGEYSKHKVILAETSNQKLAKCLMSGYSYTNCSEETVHFADYLGHIFIENGKKGFLGVICTSCNILYRPLLYQQESIRAIEGWGIYYRTKDGDLKSYLKHFNTKMATTVVCDKCKLETTYFYIKISGKAVYHLCNHAPNKCYL